MRFGIAIPIHRNLEPQLALDIATKAEELGFDSVWVSDHIVVPTNYLDRFSEVFYDPFVLLSTIAARTKNIKLGTSVIILPYRNPIVVAKMISTLDVLSNGRVIFGIGAGWMKEEFNILGIPFTERGKRTNEYIKIMKELWEKDDPRFDGDFFKFSDIRFYPKPVQKPHPPIWIGGSSKSAMKRAAMLAEGWHPTWIGLKEIEKGIAYIEKIRKEAKRESTPFVYSIRNRLNILDKKGKQGFKEDIRHPFPLYGTPEEIVKRINTLKETGISYIVVDIRTENDKQMFDTMEKFSRSVLPAFL